MLDLNITKEIINKKEDATDDNIYKDMTQDEIQLINEIEQSAMFDDKLGSK